MPDPIIELEHVNVARGEQMVLKDIQLRIAEGEHVVILGPNGCGKSTLLKTLTCELYPVPHPLTRVQLFGRPRWDVTHLRRKMGVVSADLPGEATRSITGADAIVTGFFSSSKLWPNLEVTDKMRARSAEILVMVGAERLATKVIGEMSAGQQRRIMIGRALAGAGDAQMLLLDEPSNALDLAAQHDLRAMLSELARVGVAILMITHHISDVLPEINRVVMMKDGQITADGRKQDLLAPPSLSRLFEREIQVADRDGVLFAW